MTVIRSPIKNKFQLNQIKHHFLNSQHKKILR